MSKLRRFHSLATRFSVFAALLVIWMASAQIIFRLGREHFSLQEHTLVSLVLLIFAVAVVRLTSRVFVRPLVVLEKAIAAVGRGGREQIRTSRTSDEIERLGESFNQMIAALAHSEKQVRDYQLHLEQKIRQRTTALEEAMKSAEAASSAKSEFLANMSHELRTPMNGVLGMIDIVLESELRPGQRDELLTARECSMSLLALLNDILDLSKIEAGKMTLEKICFVPRAFVEDVAKAFLPRARQKGIELVCETVGEIPDYLLGDPLRLRQIVINLLGNAIKFTDRGSVKLRLSSRPAGAPGKAEISIDVIDTGVGIPPDKLATIFEEFTQADGSTTRRFGGTGLGLAITKMLVELHDGRIQVESEAGRGSAFRATLELEETEPMPQDLPQNEFQRTVAASAGQPRTGRILVVDDNLVNQKVAAGLLTKRGYETHVVNHGQEALEALETRAFDLVLMDIQMPVMDGIEATRRIREDSRWRTLPVVGLTAHAMRGDRERCLEAGMDEYVVKPIQPPVLLAVIQKLLAGGGRAAAREAELAQPSR